MSGKDYLGTRTGLLANPGTLKALGHEADNLSEAALVALKIIERMMRSPVEAQMNAKRLNTLWNIVTHSTYPPRLVQGIDQHGSKPCDCLDRTPPTPNREVSNDN